MMSNLRFWFLSPRLFHRATGETPVPLFWPRAKFLAMILIILRAGPRSKSLMFRVTSKAWFRRAEAQIIASGSFSLCLWRNESSPLLAKPPHQIHRVFPAESLAAAKSRMPPKVDLFRCLSRNKRCHRPAHRFRPGDAVPSPVSVQCLDLFFGKVDNRSHRVIIV